MPNLATSAWPSRKRLVLRVIGGLGNQLYELGALLELAELTGRTAVVDRSLDPGSEGPNPRPFLLDRILGQGEIFAPAGFKKFFWKSALSEKLGFMAPAVRTIMGIGILKESANLETLVQEVQAGPQTIVLNGYFQNGWAAARGVKAVEAKIGSVSLKPKAAQFLRFIHESPDAVAVHIRRGDYLNIATAPLMPEGYYEAALEQIKSRLPDARFFVFSDDPDWAREWSERHHAIHVDCHEQGEALEELRLISACRHFVLSSSTFSAWALLLAHRCEDSIEIKPEGFDEKYGISTEPFR